jgi:hypothetical protein
VGVFSPPLKLQAGGPPPVGRPRLLIQYIRSYPPCLEATNFFQTVRSFAEDPIHSHLPLGPHKELGVCNKVRHKRALFRLYSAAAERNPSTPRPLLSYPVTADAY